MGSGDEAESYTRTRTRTRSLVGVMAQQILQACRCTKMTVLNASTLRSRERDKVGSRGKCCFSTTAGAIGKTITKTALLYTDGAAAADSAHRHADTPLHTNQNPSVVHQGQQPRTVLHVDFIHPQVRIYVYTHCNHLYANMRTGMRACATDSGLPPCMYMFNSY